MLYTKTLGHQIDAVFLYLGVILFTYGTINY